MKAAAEFAAQLTAALESLLTGDGAKPFIEE